MKIKQVIKKIYLLVLITIITLYSEAQTKNPDPTKHPNTKGWPALFNNTLSNAIYPDSVWSYNNGIFTATRDEALWSAKEYDDFIVDLDFKTADGTNSGVIVHASDIKDWIPHSVEIQIADDFSKEWSAAPATWQCGAVFGHQAAKKHLVKKPGEWNHYTVTCIGKKIWIVLNNELVNEFDMSFYTSAKTNPDGSEIPSWLSNPLAELPLHGHIGFQGKHAGAPIYFRNIRVKEL